MRLRQDVCVVKISGKLCDQAAQCAAIATLCAQHPGPMIVVHGGGIAVSTLQDRLGMQAQFVQGRRFTSDIDLPWVEMALGHINGQLVRSLVASGCMAVGLSGADAGQVHCQRVPHLGAVGMPQHVDAALLMLMLEAQLTPVVRPICLDGAGLPVNVNADELASAIAQALGATHLLLLSDVPGVRIGGAIQPQVQIDRIEELIATGEASAGMVPKLRAAATAVRQGVAQVQISGLPQSLAEITGTQIIRGLP